MNRRFTLFLSRGFLLLFQFVQTLLFARLLEVNELGVFFLFLTLSVSLAKLGQFGFGITATVEISRHLANRDLTAAGERAGSLLLSVFLTAVAAGSLAAVGSGLLSLISSSKVFSLFIWGSAFITCHALTFALADFHRALGRQVFAAVLNYVVPSAIQTACMIYLYLMAHTATANGLVMLWIFSFAVPAAVLAFALVKDIPPLKLSLRKSLRSVSTHWQNGALVVLYHCAAYIDLWLVGLLFGETQAGVYGLALALSLMLSIPSQINVQMISPAIAQTLTKHRFDAENFMPILRGSATIVALITLVGYLSILYLGPSGYEALIGNGMSQGFVYFAVIGLGQLAQSICGPGGAVVAMSGRRQLCLKIVVLGISIGSGLALLMWWVFGSPLSIAIGFAFGPVLYRILLTIVSIRVVGLDPRPSFNRRHVISAWNVN